MFFDRGWDDWAISDGGPADACGDADDPKGWEWGDAWDAEDPEALSPLDILIAAEEAEAYRRARERGLAS